MKGRNVDEELGTHEGHIDSKMFLATDPTHQISSDRITGRRSLTVDGCDEQITAFWLSTRQGAKPRPVTALAICPEPLICIGTLFMQTNSQVINKSNNALQFPLVATNPSAHSAPLRDFARLWPKLGTDSKKLRRLPWQSLASDFPEQLLPNIDYSSLDGWHRGFFQQAPRICRCEAEPAWAAWHLWIGFPVKRARCNYLE